MPGDTLNATLSAEAPYDEMFGADGCVARSIRPSTSAWTRYRAKR